MKLHPWRPPPPSPPHTSNPHKALVLQKADHKVADRVGVSQAHLLKLVQNGQRRHVTDSDLEKERICRRFFMALMLNDVIQEVSGEVDSSHCSIQICLVLNDDNNST